MPTWRMDDEPIFESVLRDLGVPSVWLEDVQGDTAETVAIDLAPTVAMALPVTLGGGLPLAEIAKAAGEAVDARE